MNLTAWTHLPLHETKHSSIGSTANVPHTASVSTCFDQVIRPMAELKSNGTHHRVCARTWGKVSYQISAHFRVRFHCVWGHEWGTARSAAGPTPRLILVQLHG